MAKKSLEDEPEGELHLPPSLLAHIASKLVRVIKVAIRERTIHAIQDVVSRETKLDFKLFADPVHREVFEQRRVPIELIAAAK